MKYASADFMLTQRRRELRANYVLWCEKKTEFSYSVSSVGFSAAGVRIRIRVPLLWPFSFEL
jgi:hypothetical protein